MDEEEIISVVWGVSSSREVVVCTADREINVLINALFISDYAIQDAKHCEIM